MSLMPHWGDCQKEIEKLKIMLSDAQGQNVAYMRDLGDLTCRLRMANLKKPDCSDCKDKPEETVASVIETVVE